MSTAGLAKVRKQWVTVLKTLGNFEDLTLRIEKTSLGDQIKALFKLILADIAQHSVHHSACWYYVLEDQILRTLTSLACANAPEGITTLFCECVAMLLHQYPDVCDAEDIRYTIRQLYADPGTLLSASTKAKVLLSAHTCTRLDRLFPELEDEVGQETDLPCVSKLIPYVYEPQESELGVMAREGILSVVSLSRVLSGLCEHLLRSSTLLPVLAAGLGASYSSLQTQLAPSNPSMKQLNDQMYDQFLSSVEFVNAVGAQCPPILYRELHTHLISGFLRPVIQPALGIMDSSDNQIVGIGYLEAVLSHCHSIDVEHAHLHESLSQQGRSHNRTDDHYSKPYMDLILGNNDDYFKSCSETRAQTHPDDVRTQSRALQYSSSTNSHSHPHDYAHTRSVIVSAIAHFLLVDGETDSGIIGDGSGNIPARVLVLDALTSDHAMLRRVVLTLLHTMMRAVGAHVLVTTVLPFLGCDSAEESRQDNYNLHSYIHPDKPLHTYTVEEFPSHFLDLLTDLDVNSPDGTSFISYLDEAHCAIGEAELNPFYTSHPHSHESSELLSLDRSLFTQATAQTNASTGLMSPLKTFSRRQWEDSDNLMRVLLSRFTHFYSLPVSETVLLTSLITALAAFGSVYPQLGRYLLSAGTGADADRNGNTNSNAGVDENPFNADERSYCFYDTMSMVATEGKTFIEAGIDNYEHAASLLKKQMGKRGFKKGSVGQNDSYNSYSSPHSESTNSSLSKNDEVTEGISPEGGLKSAFKRMVSDTRRLSVDNSLGASVIHASTPSSLLSLSPQEKCAIQNLIILEEFIKSLTAYAIEQCAYR